MRLSEDFSTLVPFYVVFQDETSLWWLRLLKPGFRHCYVLYPLAGGGSFLELNPLSNCFLVRRLTVTPAGDYLRRLRRRDVPYVGLVKRMFPFVRRRGARLPASNLLKGCLVSALGLL